MLLKAINNGKHFQREWQLFFFHDRNIGLKNNFLFQKLGIEVLSARLYRACGLEQSRESRCE